MKPANQTQSQVNGINVEDVAKLATKISQDENYGAFKFRAANQWANGARSSSSIKEFFAGGQNQERQTAHQIVADQPQFLGGQDFGPNPVEYLLHALSSCLNVTLVYHAAVQGIQLHAIQTSAEGEMDARGFFGISDEVAKGYGRIQVRMQVRADADVDSLTRLAMYSPVYETISRAIPVDFQLTKS